MNGSLATKVRNVIAGHFGIKADRLGDEARLQDDLGADWLDRLELLIVLEDQVTEFGDFRCGCRTNRNRWRSDARH